MSSTPSSQPSSITLQRELDKNKREIEKLRKSIAQLEGTSAQAERPAPPPPPKKYRELTKYDFPSPTWMKETLVILVCVMGHFVLGVTRITTFEYIFLDLVGIALCVISLIIGSNINRLNSISFAQGTPPRIKADKLALTAGWIVAVCFIIGCIIIFCQSVGDMFTEKETSGKITYFIFYFACLGAVWWAFFRPTKLDLYSFQASLVTRANAFNEKMHKKEMRIWISDMRQRGYTREDFDAYDGLEGWDIDDSDWDSSDNSSDDSSDDSSSDWGWDGGDSGGGGASSEW